MIAIGRPVVWFAAIGACMAAHASNFDCDADSLSRIEKAICRRDDLGALDNDMADTYRRML